MEAIVSLDCIKEIVKRATGDNISEKTASNLLFRMEEKLKAILWREAKHKMHDRSPLGYRELVKLIEEDPVYPAAVDKYLKGSLPVKVIKSVPALTVDLLLELVHTPDTAESRQNR